MSVPSIPLAPSDNRPSAAPSTSGLLESRTSGLERPLALAAEERQASEQALAYGAAAATMGDRVLESIRPFLASVITPEGFDRIATTMRRERAVIAGAIGHEALETSAYVEERETATAVWRASVQGYGESPSADQQARVAVQAARITSAHATVERRREDGFVGVVARASSPETLLARDHDDPRLVPAELLIASGLVAFERSGQHLALCRLSSPVDGRAHQVDEVLAGFASAAEESADPSNRAGSLVRNAKAVALLERWSREEGPCLLEASRYGAFVEGAEAGRLARLPIMGAVSLLASETSPTGANAAADGFLRGLGRTLSSSASRQRPDAACSVSTDPVAAAGVERWREAISRIVPPERGPRAGGSAEISPLSWITSPRAMEGQGPTRLKHVFPDFRAGYMAARRQTSDVGFLAYSMSAPFADGRSTSDVYGTLEQVLVQEPGWERSAASPVRDAGSAEAMEAEVEHRLRLAVASSLTGRLAEHRWDIEGPPSPALSIVEDSVRQDVAVSQGSGAPAETAAPTGPAARRERSDVPSGLSRP